MFGKTLNAGQICLAPDYVVVHKDQKDEFIKESKDAVTEYFPDLKNNDDYTSIINERHYERLQDLQALKYFCANKRILDIGDIHKTSLLQEPSYFFLDVQ